MTLVLVLHTGAGAEISDKKKPKFRRLCTEALDRGHDVFYQTGCLNSAVSETIAYLGNFTTIFGIMQIQGAYKHHFFPKIFGSGAYRVRCFFPTIFQKRYIELPNLEVVLI